VSGIGKGNGKDGQPRPTDLSRLNPPWTTGENAMNAHDPALTSTLQAVHFEQAEALDSTDLRRHFVIEGLFEPGRIVATYTHYDRMLLLGISCRWMHLLRSCPSMPHSWVRRTCWSAGSSG
jgi:hypothetical protein